MYARILRSTLFISHEKPGSKFESLVRLAYVVTCRLHGSEFLVLAPHHIVIIQQYYIPFRDSRLYMTVL